MASASDIITPEAFEQLRGYAAMLANLEAIGSGDSEATLAEIQSAGSDMLALLDGECLNCDDGRVWNNADPTSGQWLPCEACGVQP